MSERINDQLSIQESHTFYDARGQQTALGYRAATTLRNAGLTATGGTADYHMRYDRPTLINISRSLDRDNWLYEGALNRGVDYILGPTGFPLQAKTGDDALNKFIEQEIWPAFTDNPELRGIHTWRDIQAITLREIWAAGDTLHLKLGPAADPDAGKLQHVEAERLTSPNKTDGDYIYEQGVKLNKKGQPVAYQIANVSPTGYVKTSASTEISARDALFIPGRIKRSSATRQMPLLVSGMPLAHRLEDILTSEAVAWQVLSRLALAINRDPKTNTRPPIRDGHNADTKDGDQSKNLSALITEIGHAIIYQGRTGDQVQGITQNRPNQNIDQSVRLFMRLFGVPLGIPLEILLLDFGKANYSQARAILIQAFMNFRAWQQHLVRRFYTPVYKWQIGRAIAARKLPWRPGIFEHTWDVPSWQWIDEDKEVSAWAKKIDRNIATQTKALATLAIDRREQLDERKTEILDAIAIAKEIEKASEGTAKAAEIWRHLAGMDQGKTESAVRAAADQKPDPEPESEDPEND